MVLKTKVWDYEVIRNNNGQFKKWKKFPDMPKVKDLEDNKNERTTR